MTADTPAPKRRAYTRDEALAVARAYMLRVYGDPRTMTADQRDACHEDLGLLFCVLREMFPSQERTV